jgi:hypothetical protein
MKVGQFPDSDVFFGLPCALVTPGPDPEAGADGRGIKIGILENGWKFP